VMGVVSGVRRLYGAGGLGSHLLNWDVPPCLFFFFYFFEPDNLFVVLFNLVFLEI
jgi:hypothetical protein